MEMTKVSPRGQQNDSLAFYYMPSSPPRSPGGCNNWHHSAPGAPYKNDYPNQQWNGAYGSPCPHGHYRIIDWNTVWMIESFIPISQSN